MADSSAMRASLERHVAGLNAFVTHVDDVHKIAVRIAECLAQGGKVLTCGNGGSAAEALHLAEEMIGCFQKRRKPLAAVCLCADPTAMTCIANDYGYDELFARQVEGLGRPGDVLVVLTTSGKSPNILKALERARGIGVTTIGFLGRPGSPAEAMCDMVLTLEAETSAAIQEAHLIATHLILEHLDRQY